MSRRSMETLAELRDAIECGDDGVVLLGFIERLSVEIPSEIARAYANGQRSADRRE